MKEGSSRALRHDVSPCFPGSTCPHQHLGLRWVGVSSWDYPGGQNTHSRRCRGIARTRSLSPKCLRLPCAWARSHSQAVDSEEEQGGSLHTRRGWLLGCVKPATSGEQRQGCVVHADPWISCPQESKLISPLS